jgi:EpsI family protein
VVAFPNDKLRHSDNRNGPTQERFVSEEAQAIGKEKKARTQLSLGRLAGPVLLAGLLLFTYIPVLIELVRSLIGDENNSHGLLVLPLAGFFVYTKRKRLQQISKISSPAGLMPVFLGLLLLPLGAAAELSTLRFLSLFLVIGGLVWHIWGRKTLREVLFPYLFAFLAIPWPSLFVETITFPLQLNGAKGATMILGLLGVPVVRDGVNLQIAQYSFEVAAACSGMRSLAALITLGALCAYLFQGSRLKRLLLLVVVPPLALLGNTVRIVVILLIGKQWGPKTATGFYHGFSGIVVFIVVLGLLLLIARLIGLHQIKELDIPELQGLLSTIIRLFQSIKEFNLRKLKNFIFSSIRIIRLAILNGFIKLIKVINESATGMTANRIRPGYAALIGLVLLSQMGMFGVRYSAQAARNDKKPDVQSVPANFGGWIGGELQDLTDIEKEMLQPEAFLVRDFAEGQGEQIKQLNLTVIFGRNKSNFHSPALCLLGSGWNIVGKETTQVEITPARSIAMTRLVMAKNEQRMVVLYAFLTPGNSTGGWTDFQMRLLRARLLGQRPRGALLRVITPVYDTEENAQLTAESFIRLSYPSLTKTFGL